MAGSDVVVNGSLTLPAREIQWRFSTSSGPGGQHVNKANTRAEAGFVVETSPTLSDWQRRRLLDRIGPEIWVAADDTRNQSQNRELARQRLAAKLAGALQVERKRRPTRATRGSQERRLSAKRRRSEIKRGRGGSWD